LTFFIVEQTIISLLSGVLLHVLFTVAGLVQQLLSVFSLAKH